MCWFDDEDDDDSRREIEEEEKLNLMMRDPAFFEAMYPGEVNLFFQKHYDDVGNEVWEEY